MATGSISGSQGLSSGVWAQLQQQQAQRTAEQAEQKARALRAQASDAQSTADRAQENARTLRVQSEQAQGEASGARMDLAAIRSMDTVQSQFGQWRAELASALGTAETSSASVSTVATSSQPVLNADGQTTGTLLSVTA